jgi:hypothetical protein
LFISRIYSAANPPAPDGRFATRSIHARTDRGRAVCPDLCECVFHVRPIFRALTQREAAGRASRRRLKIATSIGSTIGSAISSAIGSATHGNTRFPFPSRRYLAQRPVDNRRPRSDTLGYGGVTQLSSAANGRPPRAGGPPAGKASPRARVASCRGRDGARSDGPPVPTVAREYLSKSLPDRLADCRRGS